jgi:protein-S-isoprenylcysteine O-methyltransferase Ste14
VEPARCVQVTTGSEKVVRRPRPQPGSEFGLTTLAGWTFGSLEPVHAVHYIRHDALWGALFWSVVVVRIVVEFLNAARQPTGDAVVPQRERGALSSVFLFTSVGGFLIAFRATGLAIPGPGRVYIAVGVALMWLGIGLRQWSVRTLGRFFTFELTVRTGQRVVEAGPYRVLRHPSYAGLLLTSLGAGIALGNWATLALLTIPYGFAMARRIGVEEAMLRQGLGEDYERYASGRKRLIPGVW